MSIGSIRYTKLNKIKQSIVFVLITNNKRSKLIYYITL